MRRYFFPLLLSCIAPVLAAAAEPAADSASALLGVMYWTDRNVGVYRAARDGSEMRLVVPRGVIDSIAVDREGGKLYWLAITQRGLKNVELWRGELDGSLPTLIVEGFNWTGDVAFDPVDKQLYVSSLGDAKIIRMNADGTDRKDFVAGIPPPSRLHLDVKNRKLYWASNGQPRIDRINLDGTGREAALENLPGVAFGFGIDPVEQKIYWTTPRGALFCSKLDGSERQQLFGGLNQPDGLAIDVENRKLYWAESGKLSQANLDGSQPETLVSGKSNLYSSVEILPPAE
jgi:hypothetical protein